MHSVNDNLSVKSAQLRAASYNQSRHSFGTFLISEGYLDCVPYNTGRAGR